MQIAYQFVCTWGTSSIMTSMPLIRLILLIVFVLFSSLTPGFAENRHPDEPNEIDRQLEAVLHRLSELTHELSEARTKYIREQSSLDDASSWAGIQSISAQDRLPASPFPDPVAQQQPPKDWRDEFKFVAGIRSPATPVNRTTTAHNFVEGGEFPHSIMIPGTQTSLAIYGFVRTDFVHNFSAKRVFPGLLLTSKIPVGGTNGSNRKGDTNFRISESQINIESRSPTELGELRTHVQFDFLNSDQSVGGGEENGVNALPAGLRLAYGSLGGLNIGQNWSAFMDVSTYPETADWQGPNAMPLGRIPQIAWTQSFGEGWSYTIGLDNPANNFEPNIFSTTGTPVKMKDIDRSVFPDLVGHLRHTASWGQVQIAGQVRQIAYEIDDSTVDPSFYSLPSRRKDEAIGWGTAGYLKLLGPLPWYPKDTFTIVSSYGQGMRYIADTSLLAQKTDGGIDPRTGKLKTETLYAGLVWYQHWWTDVLRSTVVYGLVLTDPLSFQPDTHFQRSQYLVFNLFWSPIPNVNFGIESQYGEFRQKDGRNGEAYQIQSTAVLLF